MTTLVLGPIDLGLGPFEEVAFFHKRSRTLLMSDLVLSVPEQPPAILQLDPYPLLFHVKDDAFDVVEDSQASRRKGWQRISLFAFYFQPSALEVIGWGQTFRNALKVPNWSKKPYFGLFPFKWKADWQQSFKALRGDGRLLVAPILQTLILNRSLEATLNWADEVASWNFQRIIPCHFDAPIQANSCQFRQAFTFLEKRSSMGESFGNQSYPLPEEDFELLRKLEKRLTNSGIIPLSRRVV